MRYRARCRPATSTTASRDSSHSAVSAGSMSGSWLGSPSLMMEKRSRSAGVTPPVNVLTPQFVKVSGQVSPLEGVLAPSDGDDHGKEWDADDDVRDRDGAD